MWTVVTVWAYLLVYVAASRDFYAKSKYVLELNHRTFEDYVFDTNHTSVIEFYAPWCGHCQQFKQEFKTAGHLASDFAQFGAINCDIEENKSICSMFNIQGFPTVLVYRPPKSFRKELKRLGQFAQDTYHGERSATKLVDFVKGRVTNFTKKVTLAKLPKYLQTEGAKRVLYISERAKPSPMLKGLSIDFKDNIEFGYLAAHNQETRNQLQKMLHLPDHLTSKNALFFIDDEGVHTYDGTFEKDNISEFLAQFVTPSEGPLSERANVIKGIKSGKYKSFRHYEKLKTKKAEKASQKIPEDNNDQSSLEKDEL